MNSYNFLRLKKIWFFHIVAGQAFEDLIDILFFESWLNNERNVIFFNTNSLKTFYCGATKNF